MKKISYFALILSLAIGITSCGKSSKRKLSNEWKVTSYEVIEESNVIEIQMINYLSMTESTYGAKVTGISSNGEIWEDNHIGIVHLNEWTIKKDGTWSWSWDYEYPTVNSNSQTIQAHTTRTRTGTWNFIRTNKGDELKKNERVLFNILSDQETVVQTQESSGESTTYYMNNSYLAGDKTMSWTITQSKNKQLQMESESDISSVTNNPGTNVRKSTQKITLTEK